MFAQVINRLNQSLSRQWCHSDILFVFKNTLMKILNPTFFLLWGLSGQKLIFDCNYVYNLHDESISGAHPGHRDPWDECTCKTWCKLFTFFMLKSQTQPTLTVLCLHTVALLFYFFSTYFCSPVLLTVKMYVSPHWLTTSCSDTVKCTSSLGTPLLIFNDS